MIKVTRFIVMSVAACVVIMAAGGILTGNGLIASAGLLVFSIGLITAPDE